MRLTGPAYAPPREDSPDISLAAIDELFERETLECRVRRLAAVLHLHRSLSHVKATHVAQQHPRTV